PLERSGWRRRATAPGPTGERSCRAHPRLARSARQCVAADAGARRLHLVLPPLSAYGLGLGRRALRRMARPRAGMETAPGTGAAARSVLDPDHDGLHLRRAGRGAVPAFVGDRAGNRCAPFPEYGRLIRISYLFFRQLGSFAI